MEYKEAMYWLATIEQAHKGNQEAQISLNAENRIRKEQGRKTVEQEIDEIVAKGNQFRQ